MAVPWWIPGSLGYMLRGQSRHYRWAEEEPSALHDRTAPVLIDEEEAVAIARRFLGPEQTGGEPSVHGWGYDQCDRWSVSWEVGQSSVAVKIDRWSGRLTGYRPAPNYGRKASLFRILLVEAEAKARAWLERLLPPEDRLQLAPEPVYRMPYPMTNPVYAFFWERMAEGYPVVGEGAYLTIDGETGELDEYELYWQERPEFLQPEGILSPEEAERRLRSELIPRLVYATTFHRERKLLYQPFADAPLCLDQTGALVNLAGEPARIGGIPFTTPGQLPPPRESLMEEEEAIRLAQAVTGRRDRPPAIEPVPYHDELWLVDWRREGTPYLLIDRQSRVVTQVGQYPGKPPTGPKISLAEMEAIALDFLAKWSPHLAGKIRLLSFPEDETGEGFFAIHPVRGEILVDDRIGYLEVERETGRVIVFRPGVDPDQIELPEPAICISPEEASARLWARTEPRLAWYAPWIQSEATFGPRRLMWGLDLWRLPRGIDAKTGEVEGGAGWPKNAFAHRPLDQDGQPVPREIEMLWLSGALLASSGRFDLAAPLETGEALCWLLYAMKRREYTPWNPLPVSEAVETLIELAFLRREEVPGEAEVAAPISRERFALLAVRALGHGPVAEMEVPIPVGYADGDDCESRYANAVAILAGLKLVEGDAEGRFRPKAPLTKGEAAILLYRVAQMRAQNS